MGKIFNALEKYETEVYRGKSKDVKPAILESETGDNRPAETIEKRNYPLKGHRVDKNLIAHNDPSCYESEQFKMLRTRILFPTSGEPPRIIMVTSALQGEGKSFLASNFAVSIAHNINKHVLLIDGDIRRPTLHTIFGFTSSPGLSEHLSQGTPLPQLILKPPINKLNLLPGGTPPPNPSELLSSESMSRLIRDVRDRYSDRYVILDTPPPRLTSETAALARQVDGIIIVIKTDATPKNMVEKLVELVGKEKIVGVVMNRLDLRGFKHYNYGNYYS